MPPCTGASELHSYPARAIGSRVTTRSCAVCARTRNVVRRSLGDHSSTRARTRGACSPASPGKDTAISSEICGIILTTLPSRHPTRPAAAILGRECNICAALAIRRVCSAPRRRGSPSRTNTLRPGGARRDPRCESVGGARVPALSGTAAGAERAQIRPPRVKEGGSDTAKRCFRGPHELAFIRSKIFIYPQFASSGTAVKPPRGQPASVSSVIVHYNPRNPNKKTCTPLRVYLECCYGASVSTRARALASAGPQRTCCTTSSRRSPTARTRQGSPSTRGS